MTKKSIICGIVLLGGATCLIGVRPVFGDATIETTFKTSGIKGMGASEGIVNRRYQGDKKWESSSMKFTGTFLSRIAGESESITITRVDRDVCWILDKKTRTYQETLIVPPKAKGSPGEFLKKPEQEKKSEEKPKVRVTKSEFNVKKTGASEVINSFSCEEYLITWFLELEDIETEAKSRSTMMTNLWMTPETAIIMSVQAEEQRFEQALAKKLGIELSPEQAKQMGMAVFASMSGTSEADALKGLTRVKNEMAKIKGYPIRTSITWTFEGEEAKGLSNKEDREESPADLSGGIGGLLSGIVGKMVQKKVEEKMASKNGTPFFSTTMEVKIIDTSAVLAETFEIPAGYIRK